MRLLRTAALLAGAAFVGSALAGLPPVRDGLDRLSERVERRLRAPRRWDVIRGVRWFEEDRRLARNLSPAAVERIVRSRVARLNRRERTVYAEAGRRDARRALARPRTPHTAPVTPGPWPSTPADPSHRVSGA